MFFAATGFPCKRRTCPRTSTIAAMSRAARTSHRPNDDERSHPPAMVIAATVAPMATDPDNSATSARFLLCASARSARSANGAAARTGIQNGPSEVKTAPTAPVRAKLP